MLARLFKSRVAPGFYIDVGAMDPLEGSVTRYFYDLGWCGINIEPDRRFYDKLVVERTRDINLNIALGESDETRMFYLFQEQGISTFSEKFRDYFVRKSLTPETLSLKLTTLARVCRDHVTADIDFLKIDAEGWEGPIIRGADWSHFRPVALVVESTEPYSHVGLWDEWEPALTVAGYVFVYFDGLNRFYLREESQSLRGVFDLPPNALDDFTLVRTVRAECDREALKAENVRLATETNRLCESAALERRKVELLEAEEELERRRAEHFEREANDARGHAERSELEAAEARSRAERSELEAAETRSRAERSELEVAEARSRAERSELQAAEALTRANEADLQRDAEIARAEILAQQSLQNRLWVGQLSQELAVERVKSRRTS